MEGGIKDRGESWLTDIYGFNGLRRWENGEVIRGVDI